MAAYAGLLSLNFTIDQIPSSIPRNKSNIESLKVKIMSLLQFLEDHSQVSSEEIHKLELRITFLCRMAEDVIESYVVVQLNEKSGDNKAKSSLLFSEDLQKIMQEFDSLKKTTGEIMAMGVEVNESQKPRSSACRVPPRANQSAGNTMVGFDEHVINVMGAIRSQKSSLQVLALVGMGGIGKTTLAQAVYDKPYIKENFKIRLWCTISQSYNLQDIFLSFLHGLAGQIKEEDTPSITETSSEDEHKLGVKLHKALFGRRYLIVLDDVWDIEVWNSIRRYFPDNGDHSRVIVTTRLLEMASQMASSEPYKLELLDEHKSWTLLKKQVFAQHDYPMLENIGREISASCGGLPLAIVVIGGQLVKSDMTVESWKHVRAGINSIINSEGDNHCLKILSLSYDSLPVYLKPCFLSMGVFPEDSEVRVSKITGLWVTEGFLKPRGDKCPEDTALHYLRDLVQRNLILVSKQNSRGRIKCCRIHDLLRDLCLRKSQEQRFLCIKRFSSYHIPHVIDTESSINMQRTTKDNRYHFKTLEPLRSTLVSTTCLRSASMSALNSRCLTLGQSWFQPIPFSLASLESLSMFWNLQTLNMNYTVLNQPLVLPSQIWEMSLFRHIEITPQVILAPLNANSNIKGRRHHALENLQTLLIVHNFNLHDDVVRRIPNVRKLKIHSGSLENLSQLCKLESLSLSMARGKKISTWCLSFPQSLKKLALNGGGIPWKDMTVVGSLPNLEVLKLKNNAFCGREWRPLEGQFCQLKYLLLEKTYLEHWDADSLHFPRLERLVLHKVLGLEEIPLGIGDISTIQSITLVTDSNHLAESAKQIQENQESMGNCDVQFHVTLFRGLEAFICRYLCLPSDENKLWYIEIPRRGRISVEPTLQIPNLKLEISEAIDDVVKLEEDLHMFESFYNDSIMKRREDKFVLQIKDVVDEAKKIIDAFDMIHCNFRDISMSFYERCKNNIAREFKDISLRVQDIYHNVEFNKAYKQWLEAWEPQIRSTSMEDIYEQKARKAGQQAERSQGRRLHSPKKLLRESRSRIRTTPQCRWR